MNMLEPAQFITDQLRGTLRSNVPMSQHTSWRAGGYAERVYQPADLADLIVFLCTLPADEPIVAVGLGSNLLVRDGGLRGTVLLLHAALTEMRIEADGLIYVQAGVSGAKLARFAAKHNLRGAEFFAGIPGTLGGMLAMNAGCYGSETWNVVANAQTIMRSGKLLEREPDDYEIGYRHVVLRKKDTYLEHDNARIPNSLPFHQEEFFVGARLRLPPGDGEVARREIKALLSKRIASQPLNMPNAGSVFRNPPNDYAARLIEQCGLKSLQIGGARVSEQHANFIVNVGGATAADIENLINEVQASVQQKTGICLHPEVRIIGEYASTHE
jgi:UDP-N-acetylmuramate dehydrogenase